MTASRGIPKGNKTPYTTAALALAATLLATAGCSFAKSAKEGHSSAEGHDHPRHGHSKHGDAGGAGGADPHAHHKHHGQLPKETLKAAPVGGSSSNAQTWGGRLPKAGEILLVPRGATVIVDSPLPPLGGIKVEGTLKFADKELELRTGFLYVNGGTLEAGTATKPFAGKLTITLTGKPPQGAGDELGVSLKAFTVMDGVLDLHGQPRALSWTRLGADVAAGAREITLAEDAGWKPGDRIVIATSSKKMEEHEVADVESVQGRVVRLKAPLKFPHFGTVRRFEDVSVDVRAEVGLLNRNIVIRGDESSHADKFGGHVMVMAQSDVKTRVSNVELTALGQFDRAGRYSFHWHLVGNRCSECYVKDSSIHDSVQRGIVVHDTSKVLVQGNVIYNTVGHNVIVETETTAGNTFDRNLALVNKAPSPRFTDPVLKTQSDEIPGNFWVRNASNTFTGNAAAGSVGMGYFFESTHGGPLLFQRNSQHAAMAKGFERDFNIQPGVFLNCAIDHPLGADSRITDLTTYHNGQSGFWPENCSHFSTKSANSFEVARIVAAENASADYQFRTVGDAYTVKDGVLVGSLDPARKATQPAVHIQYGSTVTLVNPTFVNYGRTVLDAADILSPLQAIFRVSGARFLNSSADADTPPGDNYMVEALDDSYQPRGTYVSPKFRGITVGACTEQAPGDEGTLWCPRFSRGAFLWIRKGDKTPTEDGQALGGGTPTYQTSDLVRVNDGVVIRKEPTASFGSYSVAVAPGLIYELSAAQSGRLSIGIDPVNDAGPGGDLARHVEVVVKTGAPRAVYKSPRGVIDGDGDGPHPAKASNALPAATSLTDFRSRIGMSYFYDTTTGKLHVGASGSWLLVEP